MGVGKAVVNLIDIAISQDLTGLVLDPSRVDALFLAYLFKTTETRAFFSGRQRGTTIKGVSRFDVEALPVFLPTSPRTARHRPRPVRRPGCQGGPAARGHAGAGAQGRLMAHLFAHGTRGEPTKQTPIGEMPVSWGLVELGEIITEGPQNGIYKHASLYGDGTNILRIDDFDNDGNIVNLSLNPVRLTPDEVDRYRLNENDLVINRVNSLTHLGKCALIPKFAEVTVFESNMMRFRVDETRASPSFVFRLLTTQGNRDPTGHGKASSSSVKHQSR